MNKTIFKGTCTAMITPFTEDGIDYKAFARQIEYQIENGIDALCAFHAVKNSKKPTAPKTPVTGRLSCQQPCVSEFFSSRELDRLSARELENPDVFKKAMRSLRRL